MFPNPDQIHIESLTNSTEIPNTQLWATPVNGDTYTVSSYSINTQNKCRAGMASVGNLCGKNSIQ